MSDLLVPELAAAPSPATTYWVPVGPSIIVPPGTAYGTSLPGSPVDGQEAVLVDSTANPSYQWRFRYNAGSSSAYKWEFVGGASAASYVATDESCSSGVDVDLATVGPSLTLPRGGDYLIGGSVGIHGATAVYGVATLTKNGTSILSGIQSVIVAVVAFSNAYGMAGLSPIRANCAANDLIRLMYHTSGAAASFYNRALSVTPVRVA